ncbi:unnamed protein product [Diatraea saccharalis]|uniref:Uncharacterized protein n=1 Tax=Diatraea saccharalis TaxID=40085 RepID=A0A9N9QPE2_9NEOP|nr:unnamed protein product [Diatraea saccharalis]
MSELLHASGGEPALLPNEFRRLQFLLRSYVQHLIVPFGKYGSDNAFESVADYMVDENYEFIENMANITGIRDDIDPVESIRALVRSRLPAVIACVMSGSNNELFVVRFYAMFLRIYTELCALVCHMCTDGVQGFRLLHMAFLDQLVEQFDEPIRSSMRVFGLDNMMGILGNLTNHHESIAQFVRRRDGVMPDLPRPEPMEEVVNPSLDTQDEPMEITLPPTSTVTSEVTSSTGITIPTVAEPDLNSLAMQSPTVASSTNPISVDSPIVPCPRVNKAQRTSTATSPQSTSSDQNIRIVPPMVILQHWGEEWVPVFTRDQQAQQPEPSEPYSDAYLSGMPSRKRRCVRQSRPSATLDGLMNESVREASSRDDSRVLPMERVESNSAIRLAFRERLRHMARTRANNSEDFDPHRYASAARFLNAPSFRSNRQDESDNDNKENGV